MRTPIGQLRSENEQLLKDAHWEDLRKQGEEASRQWSSSSRVKWVGTDSISSPPGLPMYFDFEKNPETASVTLSSKKAIQTERAGLWSVALALAAVGVLFVSKRRKSPRRQVA